MTATVTEKPALTPPRPPRSSRRRFSGRRLLLQLVLSLGALTMLLPFLWMVLTSLKTPAELSQFPPTFLPQEWAWSNYREAMNAAPFLTYFRNSLFISITHTLITVVFGGDGGLRPGAAHRSGAGTWSSWASSRC